jgi:hypothetical protein
MADGWQIPSELPFEVGVEEQTTLKMTRVRRKLGTFHVIVPMEDSAEARSPISTFSCLERVTERILESE